MNKECFACGDTEKLEDDTECAGRTICYQCASDRAESLALQDVC